MMRNGVIPITGQHLPYMSEYKQTNDRFIRNKEELQLNGFFLLPKS
jgi:hypothetical protein